MPIQLVLVIRKASVTYGTYIVAALSISEAVTARLNTATRPWSPLHTWAVAPVLSAPTIVWVADNDPANVPSPVEMGVIATPLT
jgi:hypothetical protein